VESPARVPVFLELFVLIDDASNTNLASQCEVCVTLINARPYDLQLPSGTCRIGTVLVVHKLPTKDHSSRERHCESRWFPEWQEAVPYCQSLIIKRCPEKSRST